MVCLAEHLRLAAVIWRKTTKFILSVISKEGPRRGSVRPPPPIPDAAIPEWECEKWHEPAEGLVTAELLFLALDQKYLCSPSPIVETNENFYTGTPPIHNEFLTLQEMPLSHSVFSQALWCMKGSWQTVKKKKKLYKFGEEDTVKAQALA